MNARRRWVVALAVLAVAYAFGGEWQSIRHQVPENHLLDLLTGLSYLGAGLVALDRRPGNRIGTLMLLYGVSWFFGNWGNTGVPVLVSLGYAVGGFDPLLAHLALSYPTGRLQTTFERAGVTFAYVVILLVDIGVFLTWSPRADGCAGCVASIAPFPSADAADTFRTVGDRLAILLIAWLLVAIVLRWRRASRAERHELVPLWIATAVLGLAFLLSSFVDPDAENGGFGYLLWEVRAVLEIVLPLLFLAGLLRSRIARGAVSDLLVDLSRPLPPGGLQDALSRTLSDPSIRVVFVRQGGAGWVDADGRPAEPPTPAAGRAGRAVTLVDRGDGPIAALVHDPAIDDGLVRAAASAAGMAIENERLRAEVLAQLEEVRASRSRIVEAADTERRRVERDLHDGAQQRLLTVSLALHAAERRAGAAADPEVVEAVRRAADELKAAIDELRELARGIHPTILTDEGLAAALESLADHAAVPVSLRAVPAERFSAALESTVYFVVSESLANVARHGHATVARVLVARRNGVLLVEVADDGVGGADLSKGSGLRGLEDRVAAVDGRFAVTDGAGGGTTVRAELPIPAPGGSS